jgi:hypothetical protein
LSILYEKSGNLGLLPHDKHGKQKAIKSQVFALSKAGKKDGVKVVKEYKEKNQKIQLKSIKIILSPPRLISLMLDGIY